MSLVSEFCIKKRYRMIDIVHKYKALKSITLLYLKTVQMYTTNILKQTHIGSFTHCSRRRKCAAVRCPPETGKIKNCTHCNSPIKCWLSSGPSPLRLSNWLWLACGWERARGSAGHPSRAFHMGADIAIILSDDSSIQLSELVVHDSVVSVLSHRKEGWVRIMKP